MLPSAVTRVSLLAIFDSPILQFGPLACGLLGGDNPTEQMQSQRCRRAIMGIPALPLPSLSLAGYNNSNNYRGHSDPGRFLLKLNSLTRSRCDERNRPMTKTNLYMLAAINIK